MEYAFQQVGRSRRRCTWSIEERNFVMTLVMFESHFSGAPPVGPRTMKKSTEILQDTLRKSLEKADVRESYAKNVDIWMRLRATIHQALPVLSRRSLREAYSETVAQNADIPESSTLIAENHAALTMDLTLLNTLLLLARNMLAIKQVAQDICAAVQFDRQVIKLIVLCVNVTSKGYDGENVDVGTREKLNDVTELYKKLLMSCLQVIHNLTMGNDRQKMAFCVDMLFDNDMTPDVLADGLNVDVVYEEVLNWLRHDKSRSPIATEILIRYAEDVELGNTPGPLPEETMDELIEDSEDTEDTQELLPELGTGAGEVKAPRFGFEEVEDSHSTDQSDSPELHDPESDYHEPDDPELETLQSGNPGNDVSDPGNAKIDKTRFRVSREIDDWWLRVRDQNHDGWVVQMETVEGAQARAQACKENGMERFGLHNAEPDSAADYDNDLYVEDPPSNELADHDELENGSMEADDGQDDEADEGEDEDDDSYVEGPLRGLLTEVPNILDAKQIEALHMTVKACIVDSMGCGLTQSGENLQKTRCKMFLALDCGKNLLREMLVFIAVWEEKEDKFIFQITAQIIESFHHNALLPYAWNSLRVMKDIVSPAQTVLLRLINYMFRARKEQKIYSDLRESERDAKLIHFLFNYFRCRVVPDCIALIHAQAQIRNNQSLPGEFPVDLWDMERAKDGLCQYLDFLLVISQIPEMRLLLVKWEAVYELLALLKALWAGVERKSFDDRNAALDRAVAHNIANLSLNNNNSQTTQTPQPQPQATNPPPHPPLHDTPHKFPWSGVKSSILEILSYLVGQPGGITASPEVQAQVLKHDGVDAVLMCCCYDGWNELGRQRAELCLKFITMGCTEAQDMIRSLRPVDEQRVQGSGSNGIRVDI